MRLALWAAAGVMAPGIAPVRAADTPTAPPPAEQVEQVVVTGSLIPQTVKETAQPVTVISAEDMKQKGFVSVADALQRSSLATGSVQGPQFVNGFTPGATSLSLFGLSPSYTKILIDGRPIADYPALYNGTDIITDISTIPTVLVDHIDILPGGQSSIYGSDAIAGVVNIVLKQKQDGAAVDLRYGWTNDGGGTQKRIGVSEGFSIGGLNVLVGGQYDKIDPIWGYQRSLTRQYFAGNPDSPPVAERDWVAISDAVKGGYYFLDPDNCGNVTGQFRGTAGLQSRPGIGQYCGTTASGFNTVNNGTESTQGFVNATYDINDKVQLFTEVLISHAVTRFNPGTTFFVTDYSGKYADFYDPNIGDVMTLQHVFSPEEAGNLAGQDNKDTNNTIRATLGVRGDVFSSGWKYTADFTYTDNKLTEATHLGFTSEIENFFSSIMGPQLGTNDDFGLTLPVYSPDYAKFYQPITPAQYASFTGYAYSYSRTEDSLARGQLTNTSLFHLPGGDAGIALAVEGGRQSWEYNPDPRFLDGEAWLYTSVAGAGQRTRYAGTVELRLPVISTVTLTASGRYDDYKVADDTVDKFTYNLGLEYRPLKSLLLRGRYGTAFKAPTLSDEFQGQSGFFTNVTDYYWCATHVDDKGNPFTAANGNLQACGNNPEQISGSTKGNPALNPITATVSDVGVVWSPVDRSAISVDYMHWDIKNEVYEQDLDQLLRTESACRLGQLDATTPTCVAAESQVQRSALNGTIDSVYDPKLNLSEEKLGVLLVAGRYTLLAGSAGSFTFDLSYTRLLNHGQELFPGDPEINLLNNPFYSTEFRTKENLGVTWSIGNFSTTAYIERYGETPNNIAQNVGDYSVDGTARLGAWTIANLSASYEAIPGLTVQFNVNNVFNRQPPMDNTYLGTDNQPYNIFNYNDYGREYFVGLSYKMGR